MLAACPALAPSSALQAPFCMPALAIAPSASLLWWCSASATPPARSAQHTSRPWPRGPACLATLVLPWRPLACCCTNSAASSCRQHFQPPPTDLPPHLACAAVLRRLEGGCLEWGEARCIESPLPEPHAQGAGTQGRRRHRSAVARHLINCRQGGQPLAAQPARASQQSSSCSPASAGFYPPTHSLAYQLVCLWHQPYSTHPARISRQAGVERDLRSILQWCHPTPPQC